MGGSRNTGYRRLPGRGPQKTGLFSHVGSRCRLYLGEDHILAVDSHGFSEDYKRFYFNDIQAFILRRTRRWEIGMALLACACACAAGLSLASVRSHGLANFLWALSALCFILLLIHGLRGPTCVCHVATAVQEDLLPSLNRLRVAAEVIPLLESAIEYAQGRVIAEEVEATPVEVSRSRSSPFKATPSREGIAQGAGYRGSAHLVAFSLLVAMAVLTTADLAMRHLPSLMALCTFLGVAYSVFLVISLVKQRGGAVSGKMRAVTWACLAFICVSFVLGYAIMVYAAVRGAMLRPRVMATDWDVYRPLLLLSPHGSPFLTAIYGFEAICSFVLGSLGLASVLKWRRERAVRSIEGEAPRGTSMP